MTENFKEELQPQADLENVKKLLDQERKSSKDCLDRLRYLQADLENLRKRCDRQVEEAKAYSTERLVIQLLDVVDELELAIKNAETSNSAQALVDGVKMTLKRLRKVLEQEGVSPIESEGKPFQPSEHHALIMVERSDVEGCVVLEEVRKGYMMKNKVIRPSLVKVAVKPLQTQDKKEKKENE